MQNKSTIEQWQESILSLDEEKFFDLMRLYLGPVKTPYNKQRLISQLASFIRTEENYRNIISLLDEFDVKILSAIGFIPSATEEFLLDFFGTDYTYSDIYSEVSNLKERLILFSVYDKYNHKNYLKINPFLSEELEPFVKLENLIKTEKISFYSMEDAFCISPEFIGALVSFLKIKGCSFKNDGGLKKGDLNRIQDVFKDKSKCVELLIKAFFNLNLIREGEKHVEMDSEKFRIFSNLPFNQAAAFLCAASVSRFSREMLRKQAQLFLDIVSSIPETGYSISSITKIAYLAQLKGSSGSVGAKSRFSMILDAARQENGSAPETNGSVIENLIDSAIAFGLLQNPGKTEDGNQIYTPAPVFTAPAQEFSEVPKVLNIDSTYTVSVMPGLSLQQFLPLTDFLGIKNWGIVSEYEITRQSITNAFDDGWTPDSIFAELKKYTNYDFPQNMEMSVEDWYNSYLSARIYQGYVLKVTRENITFVENNPKIQQHIKEKLAEGIYLLNIPVNADISEFIAESGLEFMGKIKNPQTEGEKINFPALTSGHPLEVPSVLDSENAGTEADTASTRINYSKANEILSGLKNQLNSMDVDENLKESLNFRIHQRLILTPEQLETTEVRTEILEAGGMNFNGKINLLDAAIKDGNRIELTFPDQFKPEKFITIVGKPIMLTRQPSEAIVRFEVYPDGEMQNFIVSKISNLRRLRF